jgi:hypothetical protein
MKNMIIFTALLFCTLSVFAGDTTQLKVSVTLSESHPQKVTLVASRTGADKLTIDVYNYSDGYLLHKSIQGSDYRASLDFTNAVDGDYIIEVGCRREKIRKTVAIRSEEKLERKFELK